MCGIKRRDNQVLKTCHLLTTRWLWLRVRVSILLRR
jgi:hypothetical protein